MHPSRSRRGELTVSGDLGFTDGPDGTTLRDTRSAGFWAVITSHAGNNTYGFARVDDGDKTYPNLTSTGNFTGNGTDVAAFEVGGSTTVAVDGTAKVWLEPNQFGPGYTFTAGGTGGGGDIPDASHTQAGKVNLSDQYLGAGNKTVNALYAGDDIARDGDTNTPQGNTGVCVAPWFSLQAGDGTNGNYIHTSPILANQAGFLTLSLGQDTGNGTGFSPQSPGCWLSHALGDATFGNDRFSKGFAFFPNVSGVTLRQTDYFSTTHTSLNANVGGWTQLDGSVFVTGGLVVTANGTPYVGLTNLLAPDLTVKTLGFGFVGGAFVGLTDFVGHGVPYYKASGWDSVTTANMTLGTVYRLCVAKVANATTYTLPSRGVEAARDTDGNFVYFWLPRGETQDVTVGDGMGGTLTLSFQDGEFVGIAP